MDWIEHRGCSHPLHLQAAIQPHSQCCHFLLSLNGHRLYCFPPRSPIAMATRTGECTLTKREEASAGGNPRPCHHPLWVTSLQDLSINMLQPHATVEDNQSEGLLPPKCQFRDLWYTCLRRATYDQRVPAPPSSAEMPFPGLLAKAIAMVTAKELVCDWAISKYCNLLIGDCEHKCLSVFQGIGKEWLWMWLLCLIFSSYALPIWTFLNMSFHTARLKRCKRKILLNIYMCEWQKKSPAVPGYCTNSKGTRGERALSSYLHNKCWPK